jgi:hypothetical protein
MLRGEESERIRGLDLAQKAYLERQNGSRTMQLGIAYLWLRKYDAAFEHFNKAIHIRLIAGDVFFGMAGVAKWCLGKPNDAVSLWSDGLSVRYARSNGLAIRMPLLLFYASVVRPGIYKTESAQNLLEEKLLDRRINVWPGPIAKRILGRIDRDELRIQVRAEQDGIICNRLWLAEFYELLIQFQKIEGQTRRDSLRDWCDISKPEWSNEKVFLNRVWCEEYFLARHEVEATNDGRMGARSET